MKHLTSSSTLSAIGLAASALFLTACGGKVDIVFSGPDDGTGMGGGPGENAVCGDRDVDGEETCDDGNTKDGDGCNKSCATERGWACSGEPSSCAKTVGNGKIDAGEECDDGNLESGDGCSDAGLIEGTCEAPLKLTLKADAEEVFRGKVNSSTAGGGASLDAAACGGEDAGAGPDRVFEMELTQPGDVRLTVEAPFNAAIRLQSACGGGKGTDLCSDAAGASSSESLSANNLPAGKYFVTVDGSTSTAEGEFTLNASSSCPLENVKIQEISFANRRRLVLRNNSQECVVNLSRLGLGIVNGVEDYEQEQFVLPDYDLLPLTEVTLSSENYYFPDELELSDPYWPSTSTHAIVGAYLCRGDCNMTSGTNVIDAFIGGDPAQDSPSSVNFLPEPLTTPVLGYIATPTYPADGVVYQRAATDGTYPDFAASDWSILWQVEPQVQSSVLSSGGIANGVGTTTRVDLGDEDFVIRVVQTNASSIMTGIDIRVPEGLRQPTEIEYRFRVNTSGTGVCYTYFGVPGNEASVVYQWVNATTHYINGDTSYIPAALALDTWRVVSIQNIDWTEKTYDIWIDGEEIVTGQYMDSLATSIENVRLGNYAAGSSCDWDYVRMK